MDIVGYDIADIPDKRAEWIWAGYLAKGNMSILSSLPKVGKSTLLFHFFRAMKDSQPFLGQDTVRTRTLLFSEEHESLVRGRRDEFGLHDAPIHVVPLQPGLTWPRVIAHAKYLAVKDDCQLVAFDTLSRYWGLKDENDNAEIINALDPLFALCRGTGVGILHIFHDRKGGGSEGRAVRGGNALTGSADIVMNFGRMAPYDKTPRRRLDTLSRYGETPTTLIAELTPEGYEVQEGADHENNVVAFIALHESATAEMMEQELGVGRRRVQQIAAELTSRGVLERTGSGGGRSPFRYSLKSND